MRRPRTGRLAANMAGITCLALMTAGGTPIVTAYAYASASNAGISSQCQPLPAPAPPPSSTASPSASTSPSPSASASPSPSASTSPPPGAQLCVSIRAAQASMTRGGTAAWNIQVQAVSGSVAAVTVSLATAAAGFAPVFTSSCPHGSGSPKCAIGNLGGNTPNSFQLLADVTIPASSTAGTLTLTVTANASPALTVAPAVGQAITITSPKPSGGHSKHAAPARNARPQARTIGPFPAAGVAAIPLPGTVPIPGTVPLPGAIPGATIATPGSIASDFPVVTPLATTVSSRPAADVQGLHERKSAMGTLTLRVPIAAVAAIGLIMLGGIALAGTRFLNLRRSRRRAR